MLKPMEIDSHVGTYSVLYHRTPADAVEAAVARNSHILIDANVRSLYQKDLGGLLDSAKTIEISATEDAKTLDNMISVIERIIENGFRRDQTLVAIGGGVLQDITAFIASVLMRGIAWRLVPTTLLAQTDSCIGSKSSVNLKVGKNLLGTFYPPQSIHISGDFLKTLEMDDIRSGIGEIIKVHAIDGRESYDYLATHFPILEKDQTILEEFIGRSLEIKKRYVELDEFDRGPRNIFNFGHSFGHAIETATNYRIPHGIAVSLGMTIALDFAVALGLLDENARDRMRPMPLQNARDYVDFDIDAERVFSAMGRDKKNTSEGYRIIVPKGPDAAIEAIMVKPDDTFRGILSSAISSLQHSPDTDSQTVA